MLSKEDLNLSKSSVVASIKLLSLALLSESLYFSEAKWFNNFYQSAAAVSSASLAAYYSSTMLVLILFKSSKIFITFS